MKSNFIRETVARAVQIQRTLGTRRAAGFLRNKGFTAFTAAAVLCSKRCRERIVAG